jgi:uncharacterized protein
MNSKKEIVAVVGASPKPNRYSYKALKLLQEKGHKPIPIAPARNDILGMHVYPSMVSVPDKIDTVTLYVGAARQSGIVEDVIKIKPKRIIFNPGTENPEVYDRLKEAGIEVIVACTLVMLYTDQF